MGRERKFAFRMVLWWGGPCGRLFKCAFTIKRQWDQLPPLANLAFIFCQKARRSLIFFSKPMSLGS